MERDLYREVTNQIVADLEKRIPSWRKPWDSSDPTSSLPLRHNGEPYRGINVLALWSKALIRGYRSPFWLTYKQAQALGGQVRRGEHGTIVTYSAKLIMSERQPDARSTEEDGEAVERQVFVHRRYVVFNAEQAYALPQCFYSELLPAVRSAAARITHADDFFANTGAVIRHGGDRAYYSQSTDHIQMPPFAAFRSAESYVAILAHELTHWTRHRRRLDRDLGGRQFGDVGYAEEELVAELGAAFICASLGIPHDDLRADHAAYIGQWLGAMRADKFAIFRAAGHAQRAADYLHGLQPQAVANAA